MSIAPSSDHSFIRGLEDNTACTRQTARKRVTCYSFTLDFEKACTHPEVMEIMLRSCAYSSVHSKQKRGWTNRPDHIFFSWRLQTFRFTWLSGLGRTWPKNRHQCSLVVVLQQSYSTRREWVFPRLFTPLATQVSYLLHMTRSWND